MCNKSYCGEIAPSVSSRNCKAIMERATQLAVRVTNPNARLCSEENELNKKHLGPGTVAHTCNPSSWEDKMSRSPEVRSLRPAWPTCQNPISIKNLKISQGWWQAPVIPATWEAEAGESLEPGRQTCSELLGDSRWKSPTSRQRDSFGRRGCFAGVPARRFSVRSVQDWVPF
ncbi:60S ribosomal protein L32 [Plecturocebus cupreus]